MRIFIGLREISGYFSKLNEGFHALGVDSTFVSTREHAFQYSGSEAWPLARAIQYCVKRYETASVFKPVWGLAQLVLGGLLLLSVISRYDVFIFAYGTSFLLLYDLPILKLLGKKIFFVFHGTDARPPYLNGAFVRGADRQPTLAWARAAWQVKRRIDRIERYADGIISLPNYGLFHQKPFILHAAVGFPLALKQTDIPVIDSRENSTDVRILHSPSNPILKGTPQIEQAIAQLRARGYSIDWITISGQPNDVVLRELARCDFVVDQVYSDWLMPGFATEAALAGKPTIIAGYDLVAVQQSFPEAFVPPVHACHPDAIEAAIEKLIVDVEYRLALGQRAQTFVRENWTATRVAQRFLQVIEGDVPTDWIYDPKDIRFFHGGGVSEAQLIPFLRSYIAENGREALCLADKPELEQAFVGFVAGKSG